MASKIGNIPDAILGEILKRLSLRTLLICGSVQKSWYHFIQTPDFINLQFIYQQFQTTHLNPPPKYLLFKDIFGNNVFSLRYDDRQCQEFVTNLQIPPALLDKHTKTLPDVPLIPPRLFSCRIYWRDLAFGYVPQINDYLVVTIVCYDGGKHDLGYDIRSCFVCVYSLTTNSWKKIIVEDVCGFEFIEKIDSLFEPVIISGTAFWRGMYEHGLQVLFYYDTINNVLGKRFLPMEAGLERCRHSYIRQSGQSIVCIVKEYREQQEQVHLWALEEGPMRKFYWEKKICVGLDKIARLELVGSRNNGELILPQLDHDHLVSYDVEKDEVNDFVKFWYIWFSHGIAKGKNYYDYEDRKLDIKAVPFYVYPFVESLVLLDAN
ncbi:hypothetical protein POM88_033008 [Heracleum sosnowskyi]|uniref:F-box domain-containing protein n=1 Tax=Heracleum sosnowskyi TaxID=360622 RepID=A0AAD8MI31_9APIA|nr:hypothetical protein POM88_033008 [Heracleum sosnowskyi]